MTSGFEADRDSLQTMLRQASFELVPVGSFDRALAELPPGSNVTITCSPRTGIAATLDAGQKAIDRGHRVVPHIAARMIDDRSDLRRHVNRVQRMGIDELFVIAGDSSRPTGPYPDSLTFLTDLLDDWRGRRVGVAAYPDGHPFVSGPALVEFLLAKQTVLAEARVDAYATTQICFAPDAVRRWLAESRSTGLRLPIGLGVAGAVEAMKLMRFGIQIGVGASLRYLRKNMNARRLLGPSRYDPTPFIDPLVPSLADLGIDGLHLYTFNQVAATVEWRDSQIRRNSTDQR